MKFLKLYVDRSSTILVLSFWKSVTLPGVGDIRRGFSIGLVGIFPRMVWTWVSKGRGIAGGVPIEKEIVKQFKMVL